jgi:hypothetical protein
MMKGRVARSQVERRGVEMRRNRTRPDAHVGDEAWSDRRNTGRTQMWTPLKINDGEV